MYFFRKQTKRKMTAREDTTDKTQSPFVKASHTKSKDNLFRIKCDQTKKKTKCTCCWNLSGLQTSSYKSVL